MRFLVRVIAGFYARDITALEQAVACIDYVCRRDKYIRNT